jgi:hypothetical protein
VLTLEFLYSLVAQERYLSQTLEAVSSHYQFAKVLAMSLRSIFVPWRRAFSGGLKVNMLLWVKKQLPTRYGILARPIKF